MSDAALIELPSWARVGPKRQAHIARVVALILEWADAMKLSANERLAWRDAARTHDALRDAPLDELRGLVPDAALPDDVLHGPAAALLLARDGETRTDVLEAVRWHTVGCQSWGRTGRALYMADYLDPERPFSRVDRAYMAAHVPFDFDGTFRQVVRHRLDWTLLEGQELFASTVALWNSVR